MTKTAEEIRAEIVAKYAARDAAEASALRDRLAPQIAAYDASPEARARATNVLFAIPDKKLVASGASAMCLITAILDGPKCSRSFRDEAHRAWRYVGLSEKDF